MKTTSCRHHQGREGGGGGGGKGKGGKGGKEEEKAEADKDDKDVKSLSRRCRGRMPWKGKATNLGLGQHTGNNHLLFFYFVSLHISRPQKKRNAGKVVLVERAVQRRVLGEQSCLIYFYFTAPNTACGEEGVEVEYYSTSSSTSATVSTVFGEQGAWNPGPQRARVRRQPWEVPLITRRSDPRTFKCSLQMISRKRNRKRDIFLGFYCKGANIVFFQDMMVLLMKLMRMLRMLMMMLMIPIWRAACSDFGQFQDIVATEQIGRIRRECCRIKLSFFFLILW